MARYVFTLSLKYFYLLASFSFSGLSSSSVIVHVVFFLLALLFLLTQVLHNGKQENCSCANLATGCFFSSLCRSKLARLVLFTRQILCSSRSPFLLLQTKPLPTSLDTSFVDIV